MLNSLMMLETIILRSIAARYKIVKILYPDDFELQAAVLLHDTLEYTDTRYEKLVTTFGEDILALF